ncbi:MAG: glutathione S-transferase family protein, partial [Pseudomonadota bacterium]
MSYTLYFSPDSANLVVRMVLEELGAGYEDRQVPRKRSERPAEFFRLNPRGLLPVLIDHETDAPVFETAAILLYLADKHGALAPRPSALEARGTCLRWLFMLSNTLHADLQVTFYAERYANSEEESRLVRAAATDRVIGHLTMLDRVIEETGGEWLLPSGLSICDFYLACCVRW